MDSLKICIITHHQLSNNPRVYREAQALSQRGHQVRVISVNYDSSLLSTDLKLCEGGSWKLTVINLDKRTFLGWWCWLFCSMVQKICQFLWKWRFRTPWVAAMAYTKTFWPTLMRVLSKPFDLLIAHTYLMLGPAQLCAGLCDKKWFFDCEDILSYEYGEGKDSSHQRRILLVEKYFLPKAHRISVASPKYKDWLLENYQLNNVTTILNVPPLWQGTGWAPGPRQKNVLKLFWFSISLGFQRGVEDVLEAMALCQHPTELHLLAEVLPEYREHFKRTMDRLVLRDRVYVHPRVAPDEIIPFASQFDVGLALMQPCSLNHELAVPNKLFFYLAAGLAVIATRTQGHLSVVGDYPKIVSFYAPQDYTSLARLIESLATDSNRLLQLKKQSRQLAVERFNWQREQMKYDELFQNV